MPVQWSKYHPDWKTIIRPAIMKRANHCCELCLIRNYSVGHRTFATFTRLGGSIFADMAGQGLSYPSLNPTIYSEAKKYCDAANDLDENGYKYIVIVLTIAHVDHDETNNDYNNLKALCQKCHLNLDKEQHAENSKKTRLAKKRQLEIF